MAVLGDVPLRGLAAEAGPECLQRPKPLAPRQGEKASEPKQPPRLWDLEAAEPMEELVDHASPTVAMEVDWVGRQALCLSADGALRLWSLRGTVERRPANAERLGATRPFKW